MGKRMTKRVRINIPVNMAAAAVMAIVVMFAALSLFPIRCFASESKAKPVEDACSGVVRILALYDNGGGGTGSGFGVGTAGEETDTYITNWHVVTDENGNPAQKIYILLSNDAAVRDDDGTLLLDHNKMVECEILYITKGYPDLAILKASRAIEDHVALKLMYAEDAGRGDVVYTLGFPATADYANGGKYLYAEIKNVDMDDGVISQFFEFEIGGSTMAIQHKAHINHGNSGGPLVTQDGVVIGINTYGYGEESMEYSVSIYVDYAIVALDELGIAYDLYSPYAQPEEPGIIEEPEIEGSFPIIPIVIAIAAAILIIAAAVVMKKRKDAQTAGTQTADAHSASVSQAQTLPAQEQNPPAAPQVQSAMAPQTQAPPTPRVQDSPIRQSADSGIRLQGINGTFAGRRFPVNGQIRIGRDPSRSDLLYPAGSRGISGVHCEILLHEGKVFIRDGGSTYGTFLKGTKIPNDQTIPVNIGESFYLGSPQESFLITRKSDR